MVTIELVVLAAAGMATGIWMLAGRSGKHDEGSNSDIEYADWRPVTAEVISTLRAGNHTFLLVRFSVGTTLIQNDVHYPLAGAAPYVGQHVPIVYDPVAPGRLAFDLQR